MTGAIALRVYLACMLMLAGVVAHHVQREVGGRTPMRFVMALAAFAWGCIAFFAVTDILVAIFAAACFVFLGHVPEFITRMVP